MAGAAVVLHRLGSGCRLREVARQHRGDLAGAVAMEILQDAAELLVEIGPLGLGHPAVEVLLEHDVGEPVARQPPAAQPLDADRAHQQVPALQLAAEDLDHLPLADPLQPRQGLGGEVLPLDARRRQNPVEPLRQAPEPLGDHGLDAGGESSQAKLAF